MKAAESVQNYASSLRMYTNYTVRAIKKICKDIGPRPAGSESEKKAQEYIADQMRTCADEVTIEPFQLAPKAFMKFITIAGVFMLVALVFSFVNLPQVKKYYVRIRAYTTKKYDGKTMTIRGAWTTVDKKL